SRRRHTRWPRDWSSDVCSSDLVVHYTNAATILREDFKDTEDLDGLFSGWDGKQYDPESWLYAGTQKKGEGATPGHHSEGGGHGRSEERRVGKGRNSSGGADQ